MRFIKHLILAVFAFGILLLGFVLLREYATILFPIAMIMVAILLLLELAGLLMSHFMKKHFENLKAENQLDLLLIEKAKAMKNHARYCHNMHALKALSLLYISALTLSTLVLLLFLGTKLSTHHLITYFFVYLLFDKLIFGMIDYFKTKKIDEEEKISIEDYPKIYAFIYEIAKATHVTDPIDIHLCVMPNCGVLRHGKRVVVLIGISYLILLSEPELKAVLYHEMAHVLNHDIDQSNKLSKITQMWDALLSSRFTMDSMINPLFTPLALIYSYRYELFSVLANMQLELLSDEYVKQNNLGKDYINGSAICQMFELYLGEIDTWNAYEKPTPIPNYYSFTLNEFTEQFKQKKEFWSEILLKRIPPRFDTHPTFPQRMKNMGIDRFDVTLSTNTYLGDELNQLLNRANETYIKLMQKDYDQSRKEYYLDPCEKVKNYEQDPINETDIVKLNETASAYRALCQYDKALAIYDKVLAFDPNNAAANFFKGFYLLQTYQKSGVELIKLAIKINPNYTEDGMEAIFDFMLMMGMQKEKDELLKWQIEQINFMQQIQPQMDNIANSDILLPTQMPDSLRSELIEFFKTQDHVKNAYVVKKQINEYYTYVVGIECLIENDKTFENAITVEKTKNNTPTQSETNSYNKTENEDRITQTANQVFTYLDNRKEYFTLIILNYAVILKPKFLKINEVLK